MLRILAVLTAFLPAPAFAQSVEDCGDWFARVDQLVEPWEENTASYAEGAIRIALLDSVEPPAAALRLLVLAPPLNEIGERACRLVALSGGSGFYGLDFRGRRADYDPRTGLVLTFPAEVFDPATGAGAPRRLTVTINQQRGDVTAELAE